MNRQLVLRDVNRIRRALGQPRLRAIPRGKASSPLSCPLARATTVRVEINFMRFTRHRDAVAVAEALGERVGADPYFSPAAKKWPWNVRMPFSMQAFVREFDRGDLPRYVE
ncbi:MAG: hypothetical protein ACRDZ4_04660 [Egibacteraceae bacterium]